jgi:hypothetical protein
VPEEGPGFFPGEDLGQAGWPFGALHVLEGRQFEVQHLVIEEQQRAEGNVLGGGGGPAHHSQVGQ